MPKHARRLRQFAIAGTAALALFGGTAAAAGPASAAGKNGVVEPGELGLYFLTNFRTPVFDLFVEDGNFANDRFPGTGIGANNNTESVWNRDNFTWYVYTGSFRAGARGFVNPGVAGNLAPRFRNTITSAYYFL